MFGYGCSLSTRAVGFAAFAAVASTTPGFAQGTSSDCSQFSGTEEVECLRQALQQTQDALTRAERALQSTETTTPAPPPEAPATGLGAEQAARRSGTLPAVDAQRISAMIVASERVHPNHLQVHLENGQTWRQIQGDTQIVQLSVTQPVPAEIWRSGFGGYRMRLPEERRVLKMERIR